MKDRCGNVVYTGTCVASHPGSHIINSSLMKNEGGESQVET